MQLPRMDRAELEEGCKGAKVLAGNDYEFGMMAEKMGLAEADLRRRTPDHGHDPRRGRGPDHGRRPGIRHPPGQAREGRRPHRRRATPSEPGFVMGMSRGFSWPTVGRLAALTAVYAIEHPGPQEHSYTLEEFIARYQKNYGSSQEIESLAVGPSPSK